MAYGPLDNQRAKRHDDNEQRTMGRVYARSARGTTCLRRHGRHLTRSRTADRLINNRKKSPFTPAAATNTRHSTTTLHPPHNNDSDSDDNDNDSDSDDSDSDSDDDDRK